MRTVPPSLHYSKRILVKRKTAGKSLPCRFYGVAQNGLPWHSRSFGSIYWLFTQKRRDCRHHGWKVGCAWKAHVQQEESLPSLVYCVSFDATVAQDPLHLSHHVNCLFFFYSTALAAQVDVEHSLPLPPSVLLKFACWRGSDFCLVRLKS